MSTPPQQILLSGASGLIGAAFRKAAAERHASVTTLVRKARPGDTNAIFWNPNMPDHSIHPVQLEGFDAAVHLNGANVSRRWTPAYRKQIVSSRVQSTRLLSGLLAEVQRRPRVLLCASAVGIYGSREDEVLTEASGAGSGFLADVCAKWEAATAAATQAGIRVVHLRFGVVLTPEGAALGKMLPVFRLGLGGRLGSGKQWMSWITLRDVVRAMLFLLDREDLSGAFNLTAPHPVTNRRFTDALGEALHRPAWFAAPAPGLRLAFGPMAGETLLASQRAQPERLLQAGFRFEDEEIGRALRALLR